MTGYAPGWQVRCTRCGLTRSAAEAGMVRIGGYSWKKFILGRCSQCGRWRWLAVERVPHEQDADGIPVKPS